MTTRCSPLLGPKIRFQKLKPPRQSYAPLWGEEIAVKGAVDVEVNYGDQEANLTLTIVYGSPVHKEGRQPRLYRARQVPFSMRDQVAEEIDCQVEFGILEPTKFSPWGTPVVPQKEKWLDSLLDLKHTYQQVVLNDETKQLVTINTHGLYRVNRLRFGVASVPSLFQENLLQGIPGVLIYTDDILVTGKTIPDHLSNLGAILTQLEEAGVSVCAKRMPCYSAHRVVRPVCY